MAPAARVVAGLGVLAAGGAHLWSWEHGYRTASVGPAFLVDAGLSGVVALAVLGWGSRWSAWAGSALSAAALLGYALARTVGLFGFVERQWTPASLVAAGCEAVVVVVLVTEALVPD